MIRIQRILIMEYKVNQFKPPELCTVQFIGRFNPVYFASETRQKNACLDFAVKMRIINVSSIRKYAQKENAHNRRKKDA